MVAALAVFSLVVDGAALNFHFTGGEIALEIRGVIYGVPQTEFQITEHRELFFHIGCIGQGQAVHLAVVAYRHKELHISM